MSRRPRHCVRCLTGGTWVSVHTVCPLRTVRSSPEGSGSYHPQPAHDDQTPRTPDIEATPLLGALPDLFEISNTVWNIGWMALTVTTRVVTVNSRS
jgi:hypothetical protein